MLLDFSLLSPAQRYKLVTATVIPRPIALVTSSNPDGSTNAAPFSFFNVFSEDPPLMVLGLQARPDGKLKDTTENIRRTGEFVVHIIDEPMMQAMATCAADFHAGVSEPELAKLALEPASKVATHRLSDAPFAFECRRLTMMQFAKTRDLLIGEIVALSARDSLIDPKTFRVHADRWAPVGRLFANLYSRTNERFEQDVPAASTLMANHKPNTFTKEDPPNDITS